MTRSRWVLVSVAFALWLSGCAGSGSDATPARQVSGASTADAAPSDSAHSGPESTAPPAAAPIPLRPGERFLTMAMPGGSFRPVAPAGAQDEYRCFLLDPELQQDSFVTGAEVLPGPAGLVHHAILFRVAPDQVAVARAADRDDLGQGWTCFGGTGLPGRGGTAGISALDSAPWLAAWAPGGGESVMRGRTGVALSAGSRIVLQVHYSLRDGTGVDDTGVRLRLMAGTADLKPLETMLLVAPIELPCTSKEAGPLCDRGNAVLDLMRRFGPDAGRAVAGLQLLCGGSVAAPRAGPRQQCDRVASDRIKVRAVAGHMHLLGRSIRVDLNPGTAQRRTLLHRKVWNFDDQGATPLRKPALVEPGDVLRLTCTHDAELRSLVPELQDEVPRYVTWGEGTSDEMCLGILLFTRA